MLKSASLSACAALSTDSLTSTWPELLQNHSELFDGKMQAITARPPLSSRDQPERRADHSEQPLRAAALSWLELSPLPRLGELERLAAGNKPGNAAVSL